MDHLTAHLCLKCSQKKKKKLSNEQFHLVNVSNNF